MNKLSVLVVAIFLILGIAMWGLAGASFSEYVKHEITRIGGQASNTKVNVGSFNYQADKNTGRISQLTLIKDNAWSLSIGTIEFVVTPESLKKAVIEIESIKFFDVADDNLNTAQVKILLNDIERYLTLEPASVENNKAQPNVMIASASYQRLNSEQEITFDSTIMKQANEIDRAMIQVLKQLLTDIYLKPVN